MPHETETVNYAELIAQSPNRNIFWARVFVDELARCGLSAVCIAPGSRSTPLTLAFAEHPNIRVYSIIDERSCAFFALGLAMASDKPVAMVCSSGTATANFHPAIIEARYANVPLLVLTADRPHELRESGANQTVDQVKMYGDHVLWAVDVALPEANPPAVAVRNLRTLADRAYAKANGFEKGPVHLNFPFRKPLEPTPVAGDVTAIQLRFLEDEKPFTFIEQLYKSRSSEVTSLLNMMEESPRGLIICGPRSTLNDAPLVVPETSRYIQQLSRLTHYPIIADPLSNLRFNHEGTEVIIGSYDGLPFENNLIEPPDIIIHFGAMPTSANIERYLNSIQTQYRVLVSENGIWTDANHQLTHVFSSRENSMVNHLIGEITTRPNTTIGDEAWTARFYALEQRYWDIVLPALEEEWFDGAAISLAIDLIKSYSAIFIANSLPVRNLEQFAQPRNKRLLFYGNRGASGIDGTISTALGIAAEQNIYSDADSQIQTVLITGDLSFYHDMNGLLAIKRCGLKNITIVLLNNNGGGIFNRLPIKGYEPHFTELFLTPHDLEFEHAAKLYGLDYVRADDRESFRAAFTASVESGGTTVIEVRTDMQRDDARRQEIMAAVKAALEKMEEDEANT